MFSYKKREDLFSSATTCLTWQSFSFCSTSLMSSCSARRRGCGLPFAFDVNFMLVHFRITSRCDTFTRPPVNCNCNIDWQSGIFLFYFKPFRQIRWLLEVEKNESLFQPKFVHWKSKLNFSPKKKKKRKKWKKAFLSDGKRNWFWPNKLLTFFFAGNSLHKMSPKLKKD